MWKNEAFLVLKEKNEQAILYVHLFYPRVDTPLLHTYVACLHVYVLLLPYILHAKCEPMFVMCLCVHGYSHVCMHLMVGDEIENLFHLH